MGFRQLSVLNLYIASESAVNLLYLAQAAQNGLWSEDTCTSPPYRTK